MDTDLTKANASFLGEGADDHGGWAVGSTGDVNDDGGSNVDADVHHVNRLSGR